MRLLASRVIEVAARSSKLSRAQVVEVLEELRKFHPDVQFSCKWVETRGDLDLKTSLRTLDKTDFFTREVDELILSGKCRLAIHSAKDLPDPLPIGLKLIALTRGVDPSDSLVLCNGETLATLPQGARIGASSERREQAIKALRSDLRVIDVRGTIEKRLQLLEERAFDGLVVAEAAIIRLNLTHLNRLKLSGNTVPLQGKLAVLARDDDHEIEQLFAPLNKVV